MPPTNGLCRAENGRRHGFLRKRRALSGFVGLNRSEESRQTQPPPLEGGACRIVVGVGVGGMAGIGQGHGSPGMGQPVPLPPAPMHRARRTPRAHTMPALAYAPALIPWPGLYSCLQGQHRCWLWKHSSTGWGRCRYRPPPQMGSPWPTLRFMHKICREIQNEALRCAQRHVVH